MIMFATLLQTIKNVRNTLDDIHARRTHQPPSAVYMCSQFDSSAAQRLHHNPLHRAAHGDRGCWSNRPLTTRRPVVAGHHTMPCVCVPLTPTHTRTPLSFNNSTLATCLRSPRPGSLCPRTHRGKEEDRQTLGIPRFILWHSLVPIPNTRTSFPYLLTLATLHIQDTVAQL